MAAILLLYPGDKDHNHIKPTVRKGETRVMYLVATDVMGHGYLVGSLWGLSGVWYTTENETPVYLIFIWIRHLFP